MKEIVIISGKGGTGKTSMVSALASLVENAVLCDADVDAADLHLILAPETDERHDFTSGHTARINVEQCTQCGTCREMCRWNAIREDFTVDAVACEGCGVCYHFCPESAVEFPENLCGEWFVSQTRFGPMVHAALGIAEENSGKLVSLVRREARTLAESTGRDFILTDGPPGIGCPVIAAIGGADAVLIVTEPTVSGQHDMTRVVDLAAHFGVPAMLCVNKFDLNPEMAGEIEAFAESRGVAPMGRVPFDPIFVRAMVQGRTLFEYAAATGDENGVTERIREIWQRVSQKILAA